MKRALALLLALLLVIPMAACQTGNPSAADPILDAHILSLQGRIQGLEQEIDEIALVKIRYNH